jgi:hypothetical protein
MSYFCWSENLAEDPLFQHVSARNPPEVPSSTGSQPLSRAQRWACELLATIKMAPLREQLFSPLDFGAGQSHRFSQTSPAFRLIFFWGLCEN